MNGGSEHLNGRSHFGMGTSQTSNHDHEHAMWELHRWARAGDGFAEVSKGSDPVTQARRSFEKQTPSLLPDAMAVTVQVVLTLAEFGNEPAIPTRF